MKYTFTLIAMCLVTMLSAQNYQDVLSILKKQKHSSQLRSASGSEQLRTTITGDMLPTVAYREYTAGSKEKYEYEYDGWKHIVEEKCYRFYSDSYVLYSTTKRVFFRLSNGEFMKTKETVTIRNPLYGETVTEYTAEYTADGMLLWEQTVSEYRYSRTESILNEDGIRVALSRYNEDTEEMEIDNRFTFDEKGRVISYTDEESDTFNSYTWDEDNKLSGFTTTEDGVVMVFSNVVFVWGEQYINPYSLFPLNNNSVKSEEEALIQQWRINADVNMLGVIVSMESSVNDDETEFVTTFNLSGMELGKETLTIENIDPYPFRKYEKAYVEDGQSTIVATFIFDNYGLIAYQDFENTSNSKVYLNVYDNDGKILSTGLMLGANSEPNYTETYEEWTDASLLDIKEFPVSPSLSVYPNPTRGLVNINSAVPVEKIKVFNQAGIMMQQEYETSVLNMDNLPAGIYFLQVGTAEGTSVQKVIKK